MVFQAILLKRMLQGVITYLPFLLVLLAYIILIPIPLQGLYTGLLVFIIRYTPYTLSLIILVLVCILRGQVALHRLQTAKNMESIIDLCEATIDIYNIQQGYMQDQRQLRAASTQDTIVFRGHLERVEQVIRNLHITLPNQVERPLRDEIQGVKDRLDMLAHSLQALTETIECCQERMRLRSGGNAKALNFNETSVLEDRQGPLVQGNDYPSLSPMSTSTSSTIDRDDSTEDCDDASDLESE